MKFTWKKILPALLLFVLLVADNCIALDQQDAEIQHLMEFISTTDCTFIRNGKEYDGLQAHDHIAGKYKRVKRRIKTAEDFIFKIASRSSLSGRNYVIRCHDEELDCERWLLDELMTYRNRNVQPDKMSLTIQSTKVTTTKGAKQ